MTAAKSDFEVITSIHIYSLSASRIEDLVILTDIGRVLFADTFVKEDPLQHNNTYGTIQNPEVRRRSGKRPGFVEAAPSKFKPSKEDVSVTQSTAFSTKTKVEDPANLGSSSSFKSTTVSVKPGPNRETTALFKSFAKAKSKPARSVLSRQDTDVSTNASISGAEDRKMTDADDEGESEDESMFLDTGTIKPSTKKRASDARKDRADKAAKLRKMMDSDDDEAPAAPAVEETSGLLSSPGKTEKQETKGADGEVAWSDSDGDSPTVSKPKVASITEEIAASQSSEPRRRRGKRKVMKKKTTKDEDGYLVTKEEAVWESFSEDEPAAVTEKAEPYKSGAAKQGSSQAKGSISSSAKIGAKPAGGKGGNIMSFFGKK